MKRVIVSVINDLATDQRVDKVSRFLNREGFEVLLVGRKQSKSMPLEKRPYGTHRMKLIFEKGPLFYAEFNLRLFFFLIFHKANLLLSNDTDTLLPNFLTHKIKGIPMVFDSHELFTQTPEVVNRKFVQKTWQLIERCIIPRLEKAYTVNGSIAKILSYWYKTSFQVVRNIPVLIETNETQTREDLGLPKDKKIILMQGSGINIQRGAEELIASMKYLDNSYLLLIIGGGDVIDMLKEQASLQKDGAQIKFLPKMPFRKLQHYTRNADLGVSIDKDTNPNYRYSLPNKLFDYIHANIPVLASRLFEIEKIIEKYKIGDFIPDHQALNIANKIEEMLTDRQKLEYWKENLKFASRELNWQKEEQILKGIFQDYV